MEFITINATYPGGQYPIYIGTHLLENPALLQRHVHAKQVMVVTNETLAPLYLSRLEQAFQDYQYDQLIIPDGEQYKTLTQMSAILDALIAKKHHRDTTLIALGGGVVGDMTGFAAACYQRGVAFIQIPTTLLSQVDASIGGKTAVNHPAGKNLIGAFHQPSAVIIDIHTLNSLPAREFQAGIAEIIKAALIQDTHFFHWLEKNIELLLARDEKILCHAIARACEIKRDIVAQDEKEQNQRALLNLGHTFAHAIEQNLGYGRWLHGEAVGVGLILAANLSVATDRLSTSDAERIYKLIQKSNLPTELPNELKYDKLLSAMQGDKKVLANKLRFVLLSAIGRAEITQDITAAQIKTLFVQYGVFS